MLSMSWKGMVMKIFRITLLIIVSIFVSSCVVVQPWQREKLADPLMLIEENPIDKGIQQHHLDYREGSTGGEGAQSGGCGCG